MRISIIIPVYNGEKTINECLNALIDQDYPKKDYEIIVVDDGSTDRTPKIVHKTLEKAKRIGVTVRCIRNKEREGSLLTRLKGAKEAIYDLLLFIDSRCIADRSVLKNIKELNYQPIVGNPLIKVDNSTSRFYLLIRKKLYHPYFGENFKPVYIKKENFDKIGKGTGIFFCNKEIFLSSQPKNRGSHVSDDTKLLWNIVQKQKILKHPYVKVTYLPRTSLKEEMKHTFQRGSKFVDYYLDLKKNYFWLFIGLPLFLLTTLILLSLIGFNYSLYYVIFLISVLFLTSSYISENMRDLFIVIGLLPIIGITFELGILKALFRKVYKK